MEAANYGILSLIPLALTLLLAFWKKDAVFALFMGCLSGVLLLGHDPAFGFSALAKEALGNEDFIWILLIQVFIGIMIAFFMKAGVVKAFAEMIAGKVKSPRSVKLATWFIGLFTIDDYMSPLLRGVVMRPLTDEMRVPREKLAFILDSTCASVCTLMPFMAWGAYVAGLVADLGGPVTSNEQGVSVYISAIPFNFYAILMVLITLLSALEIFPDFGPKDAARLGFDNAAAWRDLLRAHRNDIAAAMKIPSNDFRWYAAFHDEGEHPHVHMMAWSAKPGQAYLSRDGIRQIKSTLTNHIFQNEMLHLYEQKSVSRDELVRDARKAMLEMVRSMKEGICNHPDAERLMLELALQLEAVKGKKSYGYLPKPQKKLVDRIVDEMERLPSVRKCYEQWQILQGKVDAYYHDKELKRVPLSQQKEFRSIKNAVIKEAENIRQCKLFFEDKGVEHESEPEEFRNASYDYWDLRDVIRDDTLTLEERSDAVSELKALAGSGDKHAQYLMGKLWRDGPLLTPNSTNARCWFQQAAEQGHSYAQYALGKLLLSDDVEVRDPEQGMRWLKTAAQSGNSYAAYRLGKEYYRGKNVAQNLATAAKWFDRAAQDGNQYAQYMLGKLYLMDQGVEYDKTMGIHWLTKSAVQGNAYVTDEMRKIAAAKIDRGIAKSESLQDIDTAPRKPAPSTFLPHKGQRRKPGTGCVSQINENLWEGRYSPKLPNDDRLARNIYAHSEKECEQKLAELIVQMKAEIAAQRQQPQAPA